jgi:hypothetical protein
MFFSSIINKTLNNCISSLQDCHTVGHYAPVVDTKQDWHLLKGMENDFGTVLTFTRKLDTCDDEDMVITVGTGYCAIISTVYYTIVCTGYCAIVAIVGTGYCAIISTVYYTIVCTGYCAIVAIVGTGYCTIVGLATVLSLVLYTILSRVLVTVLSWDWLLYYH